jgi:hypothetical protein
MNSFLTRTLIPLAIAVAIGCLAVSVDLHNDEVQAAVLLLLVGGFVVGAIWPNGAWRWALILGLSIFAGDNAAPRLGLVSLPVQPMNWGTLIAIVPAFIGTYVGVGVRGLLASSRASL